MSITIYAHTNVLLHLLLFSASCKPKQLPWGIFFQSQVFNEEVAWTLQEFLVMAKQDFHLKDGPLSSHRLCKGERMENLQKEKRATPQLPASTQESSRTFKEATAHTWLVQRQLAIRGLLVASRRGAGGAFPKNCWQERWNRKGIYRLCPADHHRFMGTQVTVWLVELTFLPFLLWYGWLCPSSTLCVTALQPFHSRTTGYKLNGCYFYGFGGFCWRKRG